MALIIDCLHNLGTLFFVEHLLSISSSQLCNVQPILFSCFISNPTSSMPATFPFLSTDIPFFYSSSEKGHTNVASSVASVGSTGCLGLHYQWE